MKGSTGGENKRKGGREQERWRERKKRGEKGKERRKFTKG